LIGFNRSLAHGALGCGDLVADGKQNHEEQHP
jgi:hypothetical protein